MVPNHSDRFWSPVIACHVAVKGFMFNQSQAAILKITKLTKYHTQVIQSCPNEGFSVPK
jgi:hypothetical protein